MNLPTDPERDVEKNVFEDDSTLDVVQAMIQMVYQVAVDPDKFEDLLATWDTFYAKAASSSNFLLLATHFEQAISIATDPKLDRSQDLPAILDMITAPAILVDKEGRYLLANGRGEALLAAHKPNDPLAPFFVGDWQPKSETDTPHFQFRRENDELAMASSRLIPLPNGGAPQCLILLAASGWTDALTETLRDSYGLTDAEIAVARLLHQGQSAVDIAEARERSLETIRTQIKSIMVKTDTRKQAGFVQFLSHLQYVVGMPTADITLPPAKAADRTAFERRSIAMPCGRSLSVFEYGTRHGKPVIYCTTSSRPEETAEWREAIFDANLRVIAPNRPGFSGSDHVGPWDDTAAYLADACRDQLGLDKAEPTLFVGHREGGILAADVASRLADTQSISGVVLISTGAPGSDVSTHTMRRNRHVIHTMPAGLRLGYSAARRIFASGTLGERQIVSFFVKDSPRDQLVIRDPQMHQILRDNIAYCFQDTDIIVDDVARWTSNWAEPIRKRGQQPPWLFIHGDAHDFMQLKEVEAFCANHDNCSFHALSNAAQMMLYTNGADIVQHLERTKPATGD
ncbi:hypothetical protein [Cognatiyoonia sp. IB215182]|uniref:hypothetical protein n=1 Tax=Cognatiyoonia sp. IB215182 TaxID=3097353 RepID=UPI002A113CE1|nr:hypothetical protein [Cognatiyoonia sp. IB215182]MDX8352934.1 hypothetical protein [Cognatiyoonia sp. IB215182]